MKINISYILLMTALFIQFALSGCQTQDGAVDNAVENPELAVENRYGADGKPLEEGAVPGEEKKSRFGFNTDAAEGEADSNKRDVREMTKNERDVAGDVVKKKEKVKSGPPKPAEYKFANKVSGDPLSVTLPGKNASLGQISVEKYDSSGQPTGQALPKGTPVAIPDPNNPGQKIYFKVP